MPELIVVSEKAQVETVKHRLGAARVFCDNAQLFSFLDKEGVRYEKLETASVRPHWPRINAWGLGNAADLIRISRQKRLFDGVDHATVIYYLFGVFLIHAAKNLKLAELALERSGADKVVIFDVPMRAYPNITGNAFLNYFLGRLAAARGLKVETVASAPRQEADPFYARRSSKKIFSRLYGLFVKPPKEASVLVCGSLRNLGPVLEESSKRAKTVLYDFEFHKDQFEFAKRRGIPYLIPECFFAPGRGEAAASIAAKVERAVRTGSSEGLFRFEGHDLAPFILEKILPSMKTYFERLSELSRDYESLGAACRFSSLVVEEDISIERGYLVGFFKAKGARAYCVSHGHPSVDFSVAEDKRTYGPCVTFVNCEHEKQMYAVQGWDPKNIVVTGTPRYDALFRGGRPKRQGARRMPRLLFCASFWSRHHPDMREYAGYFNAYGDVQEEVMRIALKAMKEKPFELWIKPHYAQDEAAWKDFLRDESAGPQVRLASHSENFIDLLSESDAMMVAYWSTTLVEAAMLGVPVFYMDLRAHDASFIREYEAQGFCRVVRDGDSFSKALDDLAAGRSCRPAMTSERERFYLGERDGMASSRVMGWICPEPSRS